MNSGPDAVVFYQGDKGPKQSSHHRTSAGGIPPQVSQPEISHRHSAPLISSARSAMAANYPLRKSNTWSKRTLAGRHSRLPDGGLAHGGRAARNDARGNCRAYACHAAFRRGPRSQLSCPRKKSTSIPPAASATRLRWCLPRWLPPAAFTCPMISGRGLGHTGGTLDKLESIPGFRVDLPVPEFHRVLKACGCSMIGQTEKVAPADRKLYALRDVTGTVESPYLICASIMSKKLAEGIDALVLDVKTGSGAFMKKEEDAVFLAELMVETGERMGKQMVALITDMNQPLGHMVGNALEVQECIEVLHGGGPADLRELCLDLAALDVLSRRRCPRRSRKASSFPSRSSPPAEPSSGSAIWSSCKAATSARSTIRRGSRAPVTRCDVPSSRAGLCDCDCVRTGRHRLRDSRRRPRTQRRFRRSRGRNRRAQENWRQSVCRRAAVHDSLPL